jgi:glycerol-3-phosphate acyltransferase PlsY
MLEVIKFVSLLIAAYLLGSVPAAYLVAKWSRGIDIRQYGSGNVGASNIVRIVSKRWAIPVIIFDVGKGAVMVWATTQLIGPEAIAQQVTVGLAAIIGHNWPVFLRFNGGRGILASLGVITILAPWIGLIVLVISFGLAPFHQLALGVCLSTIFAPTAAWFLSQPLGVTEKIPITLGFTAIFLITTIRRLTAPRTSLSASVTHGQLIINRLLFDRDIRDREAWIKRQPFESQEKQEKG